MHGRGRASVTALHAARVLLPVVASAAVAGLAGAGAALRIRLRMAPVDRLLSEE